ncbi:hypothetical protein BI347_14910 [Chromobacterium sphagni]|uniref:Uncharacterized protein n=1 Tax=Chromobacterium sphagni TaxID=1903179 RepID=A0A1S1X5C5_9NEIS|nr:hypothetical protein BI347_14910 [Chromobacterium sphagni]OHX20024.1 hypothetical protein BI344_15610 [Chromobacterium sphagni]
MADAADFQALGTELGQDVTGGEGNRQSEGAAGHEHGNVLTGCIRTSRMENLVTVHLLSSQMTGIYDSSTSGDVNF